MGSLTAARVPAAYGVARDTTGKGPPATPLAIETLGLRKEYGRKVAVANLSLAVPAGEVFGFLGPNGAGKSTTVKMLVGLVKPTTGKGFLFGRPLGDTAARRRLGFLPELFRFHEWLRAEEFLDFHASLYGVARSERTRRIGEALRLVGLEARATDLLRTFSKGMLQRIGIAQALIGDPDLVILDEPTSALDPIGRRDVRDVIRRLRERGTAVFLNSHLLSEVEMVCDRVAIIDRGRVVRQGPLRDLVAGTLEAEVRVESVAPGLLAALEARWSVIPDGAGSGAGTTIHVSVRHDSELADVADTVLSSGARLQALIPHHKTLEDLFVQLVETRET
jgi:ABC-2 type transport system ATP-binding protein